ncbi:MAG TPA: lysylphosphatidylglycerol synthase transmembrane domain-containing protein [Rubricoccaceae bacterium]|nr:lysylphosphatidylglycerol synthase transmembrane domain-containing protein [Rubricoccaceae bacterium]
MSLPPPLPAPDAGPVTRSLRARDLALPVGLSLVVLVIVGVVTWDPGAYAAMAGVLRPGVLALALLGMAGHYVMGGFRLRTISHGRVPFGKGVRGQFAWDFMSCITPSAIGGAPLASFFVARDNRLPVGQATAIMLFSMLLDQVWFATTIPVILIATAFLNVFPPALGDVGAGTFTAYFMFILAWTAFFAYATVIRPELIERAATWLLRLRWLRRFEPRVREEMVRLKEQARVLRGESFGFYLKGYLWTAALWLSRYSIVLFIVWSVHPDLRVVEFVFRTAALWIAVLVMPTPGGSGGIEGLYLLFLAPLMPRAMVGPTLLTWRLLVYYLVLVAGPIVTTRALRPARTPRVATETIPLSPP